jgi:hypothetical protein
MPPAKRIVFGESAAQRIVSAVKRVEASPTFAGAGGAGGPRLWNPGTVDAKVTTAITACTDSAGVITYGTGEATIYIDNPDDPTKAIADPAFPGPVTVKNWSTSSGTIPINTHIKICWRNANWSFVTRDC